MSQRSPTSSLSWLRSLIGQHWPFCSYHTHSALRPCHHLSLCYTHHPYHLDLGPSVCVCGGGGGGGGWGLEYIPACITYIFCGFKFRGRVVTRNLVPSRDSALYWLPHYHKPISLFQPKNCPKLVVSPTLLMCGSATCVASRVTYSFAHSMTGEDTVKDSGPAGSGSSLPLGTAGIVAQRDQVALCLSAPVERDDTKPWLHDHRFTGRPSTSNEAVQLYHVVCRLYRIVRIISP